MPPPDVTLAVIGTYGAAAPVERVALIVTTKTSPTAIVFGGCVTMAIVVGFEDIPTLRDTKKESPPSVVDESVDTPVWLGKK
jgi:hypothetical protein